MIRQKMQTIGGKEVVRLIPENEADRRELERMKREGELPDEDSFGDDPGAWEQSKK